MQLVDIPNDAPKIGDFYISKNGVVFEVDDIIYSQQEGVWKASLWNILKHEFIYCGLDEFHESSSFYKRKISPEEGNKYTLDKGYDCITHDYILLREDIV